MAASTLPVELEACLSRHREELKELLLQTLKESGPRQTGNGPAELPSLPIKLDSETERPSLANGDDLKDAEVVTPWDGQSKSTPMSSRFSRWDLSDEARFEASHALALQHSVDSKSVASQSEPEDLVRPSSLPWGPIAVCTQGNASLLVLIRNPRFDQFFALMIVGSSILAGAEVEYCARAMTSTLPLAIQVLQLLFFLIFFVEFVLRIGARGKKFFSAPDWAWNCFDLFVVCTSLLEIWLTFVADGESSAMMFARTVRIIRLARIIRIIRFLDHLRLLVYTVFNTVKSLIWMMVLMVILMYMFAIPLTQAATQRLLSGKENGDSESLEDLVFFFGTIPNSIFTLFMCVSGGVNWILPVTELAKLDWTYTFMFLVYQIFTIFAMLNVITGFCCENALTAAQEDKEQIVHDQIRNRQVYIGQFAALFKTFDQDASGEITFLELEEFIHDEDVQAYFASLSMSVDSAWDIFSLLDKDYSGRISTEEFISGCLSLKGFAKTIDVVKISQDLERQNKVLSQFMDFVELELASLTGKGSQTRLKPPPHTRASSNSSSRQAKTHVRALEVPSPEAPPLVPRTHVTSLMI